MRQLLAIALLSLYVFTSTECHELLKLPQLVNHFKEHQQDQEEITLWTFLCEHYAHGDVFDNDRDKDMKLPYKSMDCSHAISFTVIPPIISIPLPKTTDFQGLKTPISFYSSQFPSDNYSSIWQPPKIF
ncbi:hypothetical protein [Flavobacterium sp.]